MGQRRIFAHLAATLARPARHVRFSTLGGRVVQLLPQSAQISAVALHDLTSTSRVQLSPFAPISNLACSKFKEM